MSTRIRITNRTMLRDDPAVWWNSPNTQIPVEVRVEVALYRFSHYGNGRASALGGFGSQNDRRHHASRYLRYHSIDLPAISNPLCHWRCSPSTSKTVSAFVCHRFRVSARRFRPRHRGYLYLPHAFFSSSQLLRTRAENGE